MMVLTPLNLVRHELIGLRAKVIKSKNPSDQGMEGKIIDESFKTISLEVNGKEKKIYKENVILIIEQPDGKKVQVDGKLLLARPWERIKKKVPKY
jgi:ribonuclease P protein subunit POP4